MHENHAGCMVQPCYVVLAVAQDLPTNNRVCDATDSHADQQACTLCEKIVYGWLV